MKSVDCTDHYIKKLTKAIEKGSNLTKHWDAIASKKLAIDFINQRPLDKGRHRNIKMERYVAEFQRIFSTKYPDVFKGMKCKEIRYAEKVPFYIVSLSNFSFTLSIQVLNFGKEFVPSIVEYVGDYDTGYPLYVKGSIKDFIDWLVAENANMKSLREEWNELCHNIRKHLKINTIDENVIKALLAEKTKDLNIDISVDTIIAEHSHSVDLKCKSLDIFFHVPGGYPGWTRVIDLFVDMVKHKMKE